MYLFDIVTGNSTVKSAKSNMNSNFVILRTVVMALTFYTIFN